MDVQKEDTIQTPSPISDRTSDQGLGPETSEAQPSPVRVKFETTPSTAAESSPSLKDGKPKTDKELKMEENKAKLAEKRRVVREKAEREAAIERERQEEKQYVWGLGLFYFYGVLQLGI
ncbi:hypothetical protein DPMN_140977 [Dreissena polymorpha]|uniref:Uncharacterized protein n=1 Tax=Dreissena polymorpha TaxID=45954 RepID=A0A9D4JM73_DREPO|nr:hypothetical protein DPMN_140977 [Dreissena polymorpha]